jgi:SNF2 domain-containing protein
MKTHGSVTATARGYRIECEPHVMVRLKRVFARIDRGSHGSVHLTDTAENAHELLWFIDRFPLDVDARSATRLDERRREYLARRTMVDAVLANGYLPRRFNLRLPPREYQAVAADLLLRSGSLLVADDVGLGKTLVAIAALTDPSARPALVVTLTHLPIQWAREVMKFAPGMIPHILKKGTPYPLPRHDILIANYHKLSGWSDTLAGHVRAVIFDEVQELRTGPGSKEKRSQKYAAAKHIADSAAYRVGLSATPIYNYGDEMFHVLDVLAHDRLGTRTEFAAEWCTGHSWQKNARIANPRAFGKYLRDEGLMLRRTRSDVGRELPALTRIPHYVEADLGALDKVQTSATELARLIVSNNAAGRGEKFRAAEELSHLLRQATGIAKAPHVAAFVRLLVESGERVVLYAWHHEVYALWAEAFKDLYPSFYTGRESVPQKEEARRRFIAKQTPLLIMSLRAGAGLDGLQEVCRTVVFGELDWSPGVHEQCAGRVHRDGQTDPVMAYFLLADVGSDPVVADVLGLKTEQSESIRDPDADLIEALQVDEQHVRKLAAAYLEQTGQAQAELPQELESSTP